MRWMVLCLVTSLALPWASWACVNTTYSRDEEKQITDELIYLLLGAFAQHGPAFYEDQILRNQAKLKSDPKALEARNDLAVAYLKLKQYDKAEVEFKRIEAESPGRYRTHANLGVLYKKQKQFAKAAHHIRKSLEIQPEGHLGLGDYYHKMADFLASLGPEGEREANFLGVPYADGAQATAKVAHKDFLIRLVKADRHFGDGLMVLGDVLRVEGETQLAIRAYVHAQSLDRQLHDVVRQRLSEIWKQWDGKAGGDWMVEPIHVVQNYVENEIREAEAWVEDFQAAEARLIEAGLPVDFQKVLLAMDQESRKRPAIHEAGLVRGHAHVMGNFLNDALFFMAPLVILVLLVLGAVGVWWVVRSRPGAA